MNLRARWNHAVFQQSLPYSPWHIRCDWDDGIFSKLFFESLLSCAQSESDCFGQARGRGEKAAVAMPVGTGLHWRSSEVLTLPKFVARAAMNGHEIKLAGETDEACGRVTFPRRAHHGSRYGQTVIVESEILSINAPK